MNQKALGKRIADLEQQVSEVFPSLLEATTTSTTPTEIAQIAVPDNSAVLAEIVVVARRTDGSQRAAYKRTALFYRQGGAVQEQDSWDDDGTFESAAGYALVRELGATSVSLKVVAESAASTKWIARVRTTEVP